MIQVLKERLKVKIFDNRGVTLIELLLTLVITAILLPVIYGAFSTGYKVYEKINIESQMRDDADYVSSMIMNTLYSTPFDEVGVCQNGQDKCIQIRNTKQVELHKEGENNFYDVDDKEQERNDVKTIEIKLIEYNKNGHVIQGIQIGDDVLQTDSDFADSAFTLHCKNSESNLNCQNGGTIELALQVKNERHNKTLDLNSEFGF